MQNVILGLASALPALVLLAVIVIVVIVLVKNARKKRRAKFLSLIHIFLFAEAKRPNDIPLRTADQILHRNKQRIRTVRSMRQSLRIDG